MNQISKLILAIFQVFLAFSQTPPSFNKNLTYMQYYSVFEAYIMEYQRKNCYVRPTMSPLACKNYCKYYYDYVPSLQYKNARGFNTTTRQCYSIPVCPTSSNYDIATNTCRNSSNGVVTPQNATPSTNTTYEYKFVCKNGKITTFMGVQDCSCNIGYTSYPTTSWGVTKIIEKCNTPVSIAAYFPSFMKIYYDETFDNMAPTAADTNYWPEVIQFYLRKGKDYIYNFFIPIPVQIIKLTILQEETFSTLNYVWFIWLVVVLVLILILTVYENFLKKHQSGFDEN